MKLFDRYLDKWLCRKALEILRHNLAMCGYRTIVKEEVDCFSISLERLFRKNEKPRYFFTMQSTDGLEFYIKWYSMNWQDFSEEASDLFDDE